MLYVVLKSLCFVCFFSQIRGYERSLIDQLRWDFLKLEDKMWDFVLNDHFAKQHNESQVTVIRKFHAFDQKLQQMPQDILYGLEVAKQATPFLFLFSDLRVISDLYDKFRRYQSKNIQKLDSEPTHIINDIMDEPKNNVNKTLAQIFQRFFSGESNNMIWELFQITLDNDYNCKYPYQASHQVFYNLYNTIELAELKGYIMTQFAYLMMDLKKTGAYTEASIRAREEFENRINVSTTIVRGAMEIASKKLWRCDPKQHIKGATYDELTRLLQGHIQNEVDLNDKGTCRQTCDSYPYTKNYGCYDRESDYCKKRKPCNGKILHCKFIESHMKTCISPNWSPRRYEFIEFNSGKMMGERTSCANKNVNSWFRWFVHCSYCMCLCDEQGPMSDRYFNLRPVVADVANNMVVTGLRIVKKNRIIHMQIQEGKLLPYGYIDNSTVRWVPVDEYKLTDTGVRNGEDFHTMDYQHRSLYLDDLVAYETNYIVTGVGFQYIDNHLRLQINVRQFNFTDGTLLRDSYHIYGTKTRQEIRLEHPGLPTNSPPSQRNRETNGLIKFTHTDFDKDVAQTTVPFFDIQHVVAHPPVPLRGAGIYFKGVGGSGGFVAPIITTYDFGNHLISAFPQMSRRENEIPEPLIN